MRTRAGAVCFYMMDPMVWRHMLEQCLKSCTLWEAHANQLRKYGILQEGPQVKPGQRATTKEQQSQRVTDWPLPDVLLAGGGKRVWVSWEVVLVCIYYIYAQEPAHGQKVQSRSSTCQLSSLLHFIVQCANETVLRFDAASLCPFELISYPPW